MKFIESMDESVYELECMKILEYYTPMLADIANVEIGREVECTFVTEVSRSDCHAFIHIHGGEQPSLVAINFNLVLEGCEGSYLLFLFAHELRHYLQWREGLLANATSLSTREPVTVWKGVEFPYDPGDSNSPWEVEADEFAHFAMNSLADSLASSAVSNF